MNKFLLISERIIFFNICFYFVLIFLGKGESIRIFLLFSSFLLWLINSKHQDYSFLKDRRFIIFICFFMAITISTIFSFDLKYSLSHLKGEPLKALITMPILVHSINNIFRVKIIMIIGIINLFVILFLAYYSFFVMDNPIFTPDTFLMDISKNKFAFYVTILLPFSISALFYFKNNLYFLTLNCLIILLSIISIILCGSRGGYFAFFILVILWIFYLFKKLPNLRKFLLGLTIVLIILSILIFYLGFEHVDSLNSQITSTKKHIYTFNERIPTWKIAIETWAQKPILGWGFGDGIFNDEKLYNSINKKPPEWIGTHNIFIRVLFHTGLLGLITFISFLFISLKNFMRSSFYSLSRMSLIIFAITSAIIAGFIAHSLFEHFAKFHWLTFYIGLGIAVERLIYENSDS